MNLTTKIALAIQSRLNAFLSSQAEQIRSEEWELRLANTLLEFPENRREFTKAVLENQIQYIKNTGTNGRFEIPAFSATNQEEMLFNIAKHYLANLDIHQIIGIQPMAGPVGLAYGLRYRYERQEESEEPTVAPFTDGKRIKLEVIKQAIEAGSRKLQASFTIETMQDIQALHELDVKEELASAIGAEMVYETTTEVLADLVKMAETTQSYEWKRTDIDAPPEEMVYVTDQVQNFLIRINMVANEIGRTTRRGAGNFIVASPLVVSLLQSQKSCIFVPKEADGFKSFTVGHVGTLSAGPESMPKYKVYNTLCLPENSDHGETILVGYKGTGEVDTGYVFAPYVPAMTTGVIIDPKTFQPCLKLMTRYGKTTFDTPIHDPFFPERGGNYYGKVMLKGLSFA